jgi:hypothetical protein
MSSKSVAKITECSRSRLRWTHLETILRTLSSVKFRSRMIDRLARFWTSSHPDRKWQQRNRWRLKHNRRALLHVTINAILYAISAGVAPEFRRGVDRTTAHRQPFRASSLVFSSEEVFFLPGKIDISQVRSFKPWSASEPAANWSTASWSAAIGAARRPDGKAKAYVGSSRIGKDRIWRPLSSALTGSSHNQQHRYRHGPELAPYRIFSRHRTAT